MINPLTEGFQILTEFLSRCLPRFMLNFMVMCLSLTLLAILIRIIRR